MDKILTLAKDLPTEELRVLLVKLTDLLNEKIGNSNQTSTEQL